MKEILLQYAQYNYWANKKIADVIITLPTEETDGTVVSSFNSLRLTLHHMLTTEEAWYQRIRLSEQIILASETAAVDEILQSLLEQSKTFVAFVEKSSETSLKHVFWYRNFKKEQFKQPVHEVLLHLFNHQSYHGGQLVTILNQLGVKPIPATDYIVWSRGKR